MKCSSFPIEGLGHDLNEQKSEERAQRWRKIQLARVCGDDKSSTFQILLSAMSDAEYEVLQTIHISLSHDITRIATTAVRERHKKKKQDSQ